MALYCASISSLFLVGFFICVFFCFSSWSFCWYIFTHQFFVVHNFPFAVRLFPFCIATIFVGLVLLINKAIL